MPSYHFVRVMSLAATMLLAPAFASAQQPPPGVQAGMLTCNLAPSIGPIVAERQRMSCRYVPNGAYPLQDYNGVMNTVGLELGISAGGVMVWGVFAPGHGAPIGALAGEYVGASGDVAVEGQAGLKVSLGVSGLTLALAP
jgi:hypothetical protein